LVVVIDNYEASFNDLSSDYSGFRIPGDATHRWVLEEAKIKKADIFFAVTHEDNVNLMVAQIAKKIFNIPHVLARVFDPKREQIFEQLGIETICPTSIGAEMFLSAVASGLAFNGDKRP